LSPCDARAEPLAPAPAGGSDRPAAAVTPASERHHQSNALTCKLGGRIRLTELDEVEVVVVVVVVFIQSCGHKTKYHNGTGR